MPHTIIYNSETQAIEMRARGDLNLAEAKEIILEMARMATEKNCQLLLSDYREAVIAMTTLEIYELPKLVANMVTPLGVNIYRIKRAIIANKGAKNLPFFETVTANSGQNAKLFYDIDQAKKWLFGT